MVLTAAGLVAGLPLLLLLAAALALHQRHKREDRRNQRAAAANASQGTVDPAGPETSSTGRGASDRRSSRSAAPERTLASAQRHAFQLRLRVSGALFAVGWALATVNKRPETRPPTSHLPSSPRPTRTAPAASPDRSDAPRGGGVAR